MTIFEIHYDYAVTYLPKRARTQQNTEFFRDSFICDIPEIDATYVAKVQKTSLRDETLHYYYFEGQWYFRENDGTPIDKYIAKFNASSLKSKPESELSAQYVSESRKLKQLQAAKDNISEIVIFDGLVLHTCSEPHIVTETSYSRGKEYLFTHFSHIDDNIKHTDSYGLNEFKLILSQHPETIPPNLEIFCYDHFRVRNIENVAMYKARYLFNTLMNQSSTPITRLSIQEFIDFSYIRDNIDNEITVEGITALRECFAAIKQSCSNTIYVEAEFDDVITNFDTYINHENADLDLSGIHL